jgi:simple sugar transport system ATP-binding protein
MGDANPSSTTAGHAVAPTPVVELRSITKAFGRTLANQDIDLAIRAGSIKALLGENGAGKSTLMSMLAGRLTPDRGVIRLDGQPVRFSSPKNALAAGIGMVYQHFMLVESMTVAQNVLLGQEGSFFLRPSEMEERVGALARGVGLEIDPRARVADLSMGEKQRVEILKLLLRKSRVLIFDEPTAVLTPSEIGQLFEALRTMARQGKAIVFISHKLQEVLDVADEIAILRNGRVVGEYDRDENPSKAELADRMVGREVLLQVDAEPHVKGKVVLEIDGLAGDGLDGLHLQVRRGEIVAVAGVAGNGQKALVETVCGLRRPQAGAVRILGLDWRLFYAQSGARRWRGGLAYVPEDRQGLATCRNLDLVDNLLLTTRHGYSRHGLLQRAKAELAARELVRRHNVQPRRVETRAWQLSGGNLQKLVLAREFHREPRIIVAEQPSQGLDVAATEEVWRLLLAARERAGVLLVTGDLNEAKQLADRVAVIFRGRFMDIIDAGEADKLQNLGLLMAGVHPEA